MTTIETFWLKMRSVYGRQKWDREFPIDDCADVWEKALAKFEKQTVFQAIAESARAYPDWAPTLPQFIRLCKMTIRQDLKQLPKPPTVDPKQALEHITEVKYLMELKRRRPMSAEQRKIHWETLGL